MPLIGLDAVCNSKMNNINKYQTWIILFAVVLGLLLGQYEPGVQYAGQMIVPLLMMMLFGLFLGLNLSEFRSSFLNIRFSATQLVFNFVWTPVFAYLLGMCFLSQNLPIWIGFVLLMVTPCTDWYLLFTGIAKGNVTLSTTALPVNLILQVILLPVYLMIFFGESGNIEFEPLVESIVLVLFVPFFMAVLLKRWLSNTGKTRSLTNFFEKAQLAFLALAVTAMFAAEGKNLTDNPQVILVLLLPILVFFATTFLLTQVAGRLLKFDYADRVSLTLNTMARNSPIALAIAVAAFPEQPLIALSLIIAPLIELPILALTTQVLLKSRV